MRRGSSDGLETVSVLQQSANLNRYETSHDTDELVDTSAGKWKDSGNGGGIVPEDSPPLPKRGSSTSTSPVSSIEQENAGTHYVGGPKGNHRISQILWKHFTPRGIVNQLLRKTLQRNTWIYVSVCFQDIVILHPTIFTNYFSVYNAQDTNCE